MVYILLLLGNKEHIWYMLFKDTVLKYRINFNNLRVMQNFYTNQPSFKGQFMTPYPIFVAFSC